LTGGVDLVDTGTSPDDEQGHGTFMAGLIAASTGNVIGVASVAPLARIMPVRALDESGDGKPATVAQGIRWAVDHGARVINLSLAQEAIGGSSVVGSNLLGDPAIDDAIKDAARAGALVIAAAGNTFDSGGVSTTSYRATVGGVLVVGASTKSEKRARYSNYGPGLDVLAPGGGSASDASRNACQSNYPVVSTWWKQDTGASAYGAGCGTSMAVAHVSGIGALLMARGHSNTSAASRIKSTAVDLYSSGRDDQSGWGRADAAAAVGTSSTTTKTSVKPKPAQPAPRRSVRAASARPPAVKGAKVTAPATSPTPEPSPIRGIALATAGPYTPPTDPKLHLIALALVLASGVGVANAAARRRAARARL
jgi:serine protease